MRPAPLTAALSKKPAAMRKFGVLVPVAALLGGGLAAGAAAQQTGRGSPEHPPSALVAGKEALRAGNPLWAIPLGELSQTQARPLFSPSRRPPAAPELAALAARPVNVGPSPKREADHPRLTLLGTIVGESVAIGVFMDEASHDVVRLKAGEAHEGWTLRAVAGRTTIFHKDGERAAATLLFPAPDLEGKAHGHTAPPVIQPVAIHGPTSEPAVDPAATKGGSRRPPKEG
jgi:hypothetical protein